MDKQTPTLWIDYTNHRNERAWREVQPMGTWHGATEQHPEKTWFLMAFAMDRDNEVRDFAMRSIHAMRDEKPE